MHATNLEIASTLAQVFQYRCNVLKNSLPSFRPRIQLQAPSILVINEIHRIISGLCHVVGHHMKRFL